MLVMRKIIWDYICLLYEKLYGIMVEFKFNTLHLLKFKATSISLYFQVINQTTRLPVLYKQKNKVLVVHYIYRVL